MFVHRKIEGKARSLTVSKTPAGEYCVSVLAEAGSPNP
jgi:hypothetical protein